MIKLKRVYEKPEATDGMRILVDRLWPRGLRKDDAQIDEWMKEIAPSDSLRRWYGHKEEQWEEFKRRYKKELKEKRQLLQRLRRAGKRGTVTLVFATKDGEHSNAAVLFELLRKSTSLERP